MRPCRAAPLACLQRLIPIITSKHFSYELASGTPQPAPFPSQPRRPIDPTYSISLHLRLQCLLAVYAFYKCPRRSKGTAYTAFQEGYTGVRVCACKQDERCLARGACLGRGVTEVGEYIGVG